MEIRFQSQEWKRSPMGKRDVLSAVEVISRIPGWKEHNSAVQGFKE